MKISLRAYSPEDEGFLYKVYASLRAEEMAFLGWNEAQLEAFLKMQFNAQQRAYEWQFRGAENFIILFDEEKVGRMITLNTEREIRPVDITLLPEYRNRGAGTFLLKELQTQARESGLPLRLRVMKTNVGARRLYERLGFAQTGEIDTHFEMEWLRDDA